GPGIDPHSFEPTPSEAAVLSESGAVLAVGLGVEAGLERAIGRAVIDRRAVLMGEALGFTGHDHGHDHDHEGHDHAFDAHLWLDLELCARFVEMLPELLPAELLAEDAGVRAASLADAFRRIRDEAVLEFASLEGAGVIVQHDAWRRMLEPLGVETVLAVRGPGHGEPSPSVLAEARMAIEGGRVRAIVIESTQPSTFARRLAEETGLPIAELDPVGLGEDGAIARQNFSALGAALRAAIASN
ncbi:MAG: metal ABC transporter substrate-binding protein, partial [Planctomycetota bacterium]